MNYTFMNYNLKLICIPERPKPDKKRENGNPVHRGLLQAKLLIEQLNK